MKYYVLTRKGRAVDRYLNSQRETVRNDLNRDIERLNDRITNIEFNIAYEELSSDVLKLQQAELATLRDELDMMLECEITEVELWCE